jgi:hypothetical protein
MRLVENSQIVSGFLPVDLKTGANTGDYVCLKHYGHCAVVFFKNAGTAGDDPTITILQATDVANSLSDAKALTFTTIYTKQDTVLTAISEFTKNTQTAANTYTDATSAEDAAIWVIEFDAADLDVANGFDCLSASVADIGTNVQVGCLLYILTEPKYAQATPPDAITD